MKTFTWSQLGLQLALAFFTSIIAASPQSRAFEGSRLFSDTEYNSYLRGLQNNGIKVFFECQMVDSPLDCENLARQFFQSHGTVFVRTMQKSGADLWVRVTDQFIGNNITQIRFQVRSREDFDVVDVPSAYMEVNFQTVLLDVITNQLSSFMLGVLAPYKLIVQSAVTKADQVTMVWKAPSGRVGKPPYQGPFFVDFSADGNGSKNNTNSFFSGSLRSEVVYSKEKFKLRADLIASRESSTTTTDNGPLQGRNSTYNVILNGAYSLAKRWSLALIGFTTSNPGNNVTYMRDAIIGTEWILVPFRKTELREAFVRGAVGVADVRLEQENDLGWKDQTYLFSFLRAGIRWPMLDNKVTLSMSGAGFVYPKFRGYERFEGNGEAVFQVSSQIRLRGSYTLSYRKKSLTYPGNPDLSNPLATMFLRDVPGFANSFSFGVGFTFGNAVRAQADRRWE